MATDNDFGGMNGMIWLFAILVLFGGGFGGLGGNNGVNALNADMQRGFDNQNAMANQREILGAVTAGTAQAVAATNQTFHDTLGIVQNRYDELARDISGLAVGQAQALANQNACCCDLKQLIMQTNYDAAMRDAATNANITAQIQGVKDQISQDKIEALQAQVNRLELAQATAGIVRYPSGWTYGAGAFPPTVTTA